VIVEDGRDVGRVYEDRHSPPELRWFWSITVYVNPKLGITTSGRAASIEDAKAQIPDQLAEVLRRLDSRPAPLYLAGHVQVAFAYPSAGQEAAPKLGRHAH
jgi:hypothetical protein